MSLLPDLRTQPGDRRSLWDSRIVPSARACERFFWNLMWFSLFLALLFSFNPFRAKAPAAPPPVQGVAQ